MKRYLAFLRGINVSGKNKIAMGELKGILEQEGFPRVATYLGSGNVSFSSETQDEEALAGELEGIIRAHWGLDIPVCVVSREELGQRLSHAPGWWGGDDPAWYHNLIFLIPPLSYEAFCEQVGPPKADLERVWNDKNVVFWSFRRKEYQKTNWWSRTASAGIGRRITIRTANTVRGILDKGPGGSK